MYKIFALVLLLSVAVLTDAQNIEGRWHTISPKTNRPTSQVEIYKVGKEYFGKIVKLYNLPQGEHNPLCKRCPGDKKNTPYLGLVLLENMKQNGKIYEGGTVIEPKMGFEAKCKITFDKTSNNRLLVEGRIGFISKTIVWERVK